MRYVIVMQFNRGNPFKMVRKLLCCIKFDFWLKARCYASAIAYSFCSLREKEASVSFIFVAEFEERFRRSALCLLHALTTLADLDEAALTVLTRKMSDTLWSMHVHDRGEILSFLSI